MPYKVIVFDFDDTLVQTRAIRYEAAKYTAKHFYNLKISDSTIDKYWGLPFRDLIKALFNDVDSFENIAQHYKEIIHLFPLKKFDDAVATLERLSNKYILTMVSSSTKELIKRGFMDVGISYDIFAYIQASEDSDHHKPDGKVFDSLKNFLNKKGIKYSEAIYIGDSLDDYIAAKNADIDFLGVARFDKREKEFEENNAKYVKNLREITQYLKTLINE